MTEATTSLLNQRTSNIRDKRDRRWFWTDNALIEDYGRTLGIYAVGVYMVLCERAYNQTQRSEVSGGVIAELLGIGRTSVTEALFVLELHQLIDIQEQYDSETRQQLPSVYTLLAVEDWRIEPTPEREKFINARREMEKLKRTTPKDKPKRTTRRKNSEAELNSDLKTETTSELKTDLEIKVATNDNDQEVKQGMPCGGIPPLKGIKRRGYAATRHTLCSGAAYPMPPDGKGMPPGTDKYKQDVIQDVIQDNNKQSLATEMSVADEKFSISNLAPLAHTQEVAVTLEAPRTKISEFENPHQSVKTKLIDFIDKRMIKASTQEIDALLEKWPAAKLSDGELVGALISDYELYELDKPADENIARGALKTDAARLRWFMCVWPGFEEAGSAYHQRTNHRWTKAQCFWKRWKTAQPPAEWLEGELAQLRAEKAHSKNEAAKAEAKAVWETLSASQKRELDKEVRILLDQNSYGEQLSADADHRAAKRQELLLDPETMTWLRGTPLSLPQNRRDVEVKAELDGKLELSAGVDRGTGHEVETDNDVFLRGAHQLNLEIYIGPIVAEIRNGVLDFEDVDERRATLLEDDEWERVKVAVTDRLVA